MLQAIAIYHKNKIEFGPAKAANAGGVAVSGLEMAQNSARLSWSKEEVDEKLKGIMKSIFNASKAVSACLATLLKHSSPLELPIDQQQAEGHCGNAIPHPVAVSSQEVCHTVYGAASSEPVIHALCPGFA